MKSTSNRPGETPKPETASTSQPAKMHLTFKYTEDEIKEIQQKITELRSKKDWRITEKKPDQIEQAKNTYREALQKEFQPLVAEKQAAYEERLKQAEPLEDFLRNYLTEGIQNSPEIEEKEKTDQLQKIDYLNLPLEAIREFEKLVKQEITLKRAIQHTKPGAELISHAIAYHKVIRDLSEYTALGATFMREYEKYLHEKTRFINFSHNLDHLNRLEGALKKPAFRDLDKETGFGPREHALLEQLARMTDIGKELEKNQNVDPILAALKFAIPENSAQFAAIAKSLKQAKNSQVKQRSKKEIGAEAKELRKKLEDIWQEDFVRELWQRKEIQGIAHQIALDAPVIEQQSTIAMLNWLYDMEHEQPASTIGAVLTGPPGVGKTTIIEHYLRELKRDYTYIDASEEMTWYFMWGSKEITFQSRLDYLGKLVDSFDKIDSEGFENFIAENAGRLRDKYDFLDEKEAEQNAIRMLFDEISQATAQETIGEESNPEIAKKAESLVEKLKKIATDKYSDEVVKESLKFLNGGRNGWRDGIFLSALKRGESLLIDEANHFKNWGMIFKLMTTQPGQEYYFKPTDEKITIPKDWRMYFTGNIGTRYGGFKLQEALLSRAGKRVAYMSYPPKHEEFMLLVSLLSDTNCLLQRPVTDLAKIYYTINQLFPKVRKIVEKDQEAISVSHRTLKDLAGTLTTVVRKEKDPKSGHEFNIRVINEGKTYDRGLYDALIRPYFGREIPAEIANTTAKHPAKEIVDLATQMGLMLDESVKDDVIFWIGKEAFEERQKSHDENREAFNEIIDKIRKLSHHGLTIPSVARKF